MEVQPRNARQLLDRFAQSGSILERQEQDMPLLLRKRMVSSGQLDIVSTAVHITTNLYPADISPCFLTWFATEI